MTKIGKYAVSFLAIFMALAAAPMAMAADAPDWLKDAFEKGDSNFFLSQDVSFDAKEQLVLSTDKTLNLDLNGHKIEWTANGTGTCLLYTSASGNGDIATTGFRIGFAVMMVLDVALG